MEIRIAELFNERKAMQEIKRILRKMNNLMLHKIFKISGLTETENTLMTEIFLKKNMRDHVCDKMHISRSTFTTIKNQGLLKIQIALNTLLDEKINQMTK